MTFILLSVVETMYVSREKYTLFQFTSDIKAIFNKKNWILFLQPFQHFLQGNPNF